ncbi:hypothetical protein CSUI_007302 [Cystoisospora suis]|uniref:Transmembrane protein n=1 Tax=Cystoisospora suis TaxID=483139 RepID=A0A2C6KEF3_9APIC|nr:hypothetical protein CSUI_007302 [Cystoisospora suis]
MNLLECSSPSSTPRERRTRNAFLHPHCQSTPHRQHLSSIGFFFSLFFFLLSSIPPPSSLKFFSSSLLRLLFLLFPLLVFLFRKG